MFAKDLCPCPECGSDLARVFFRDKYGNIVGCTECLAEVDPFDYYDELEEQEEDREIDRVVDDILMRA